MVVLRILSSCINGIKKLCGTTMARSFLNLVLGRERFYSIDSLYDFEDKKTIVRLLLLLPGNGCAWARKTGGCTMCGFSQKIKQIGNKFSDQDLIFLYKIAEIMTSSNRPTTLAIYNAGSFINDGEISPFVQKEICDMVRKNSYIKTLFIESRAEFISEGKIRQLKLWLGEKKLSIGIGLEAQDDKIRNNYIKKGLDKKTYENAIRILKQNKIRAATYVLIKPIYVNEKEAIEEAIKTIRYALCVGSDEVILESAFIQRGTIMEKLFNEKKYKPPWLWSIIEIVTKTRHLGDIRLGGFEDSPPPIAIPSNCDLCSEKVRAVLQKYRETYNTKALNNVHCVCKICWQTELNSKKSHYYPTVPFIKKGVFP